MTERGQGSPYQGVEETWPSRRRLGPELPDPELLRANRGKRREVFVPTTEKESCPMTIEGRDGRATKAVPEEHGNRALGSIYKSSAGTLPKRKPATKGWREKGFKKEEAGNRRVGRYLPTGKKGLRAVTRARIPFATKKSTTFRGEPGRGDKRSKLLNPWCNCRREGASTRPERHS